MKRKLAAYVFALARRLSGEAALNLANNHGRGYGGVKAGTVRIRAEKLFLYPDGLDKAECSVIAFIPALNTRGPNGAWVIERGPHHPLAS